ncbi:MAG: hypothetical protein P1P77_09900, partial [Spirochaetaceae bacterium]|nr:hypothetical protein [Spirochaetaceae bacterium]
MTFLSSFLVLTLTTIILYGLFERNSIEEIHERSVGKLELANSVFTSLHNSQIAAFIQLVDETTISKLIYSQDQDYSLISKANDRLSGILVSNPTIHSIYAFNYLQGIFYSTLSGPESISQSSDPELYDLVTDIKSIGVNRYLPRKIAFSDSGESSTNVLTVFIGNLPSNQNSLLGGLIVNLGEERLRALLAANLQGNELMILDRDGTAFTHPDPEYFGVNMSSSPYISRILSSDSRVGTFTSRIDKEKYLITYVTQKEMGWHFITISPYKEIVSKIHALRNTTLFVYLILALISIVIVYIVSRQIYLPIWHLFQFARKTRKKESQESLSHDSEYVNELQYLDIFLRQLITRANRMDAYFRSHRQLHRQEILKSLLEGSLPPLSAEEEEDLDLNIGGAGYVVAVVRFDRLLYLLEMNTPETFATLKKSVINTCITIIEYPVVIVEIDRDRTVLLIQSNQLPRETSPPIDL